MAEPTIEQDVETVRSAIVGEGDQHAGLMSVSRLAAAAREGEEARRFVKDESEFITDCNEWREQVASLTTERDAARRMAAKAPGRPCRNDYASKGEPGEHEPASYCAGCVYDLTTERDRLREFLNRAPACTPDAENHYGWPKEGVRWRCFNCSEWCSPEMPCYGCDARMTRNALSPQEGTTDA